jgi:hypothetical protein
MGFTLSAQAMLIPVWPLRLVRGPANPQFSISPSLLMKLGL